MIKFILIILVCFLFGTLMTQIQQIITDNNNNKYQRSSCNISVISVPLLVPSDIGYPRVLR